MAEITCAPPKPRCAFSALSAPDSVPAAHLYLASRWATAGSKPSKAPRVLGFISVMRTRCLTLQYKGAEGHKQGWAPPACTCNLHSSKPLSSVHTPHFCSCLMLCHARRR